MTIRDRLTRAIDGLISSPSDGVAVEAEPKQDQTYGELASMWSNIWTGIGSTESDRVTAHVPGAPTVIDKVSLAYLYIGDPIARTVVSAIVDDGMRGGFQVVYNGELDLDADKVKEVEDACTALDLEGKARRAAKSARAVGGGGLILITNGGSTEAANPLDDNKVRSIERLIVADARDLIIATWMIDEIESFRYMPMTLSTELQGIEDLHSSHVAIFEGVDTPVRDRQELFEGWYASALQPVWESIREFRSSWQSTVAMLQDGSVPVMKLPQLGKVLARGGRTALTNRLAQFAVVRAVNKVFALDGGDGVKPSEEFEFVERSFAGIGDLVTEQKVLVGQAADMPITRLFGISPAGMNATGEHDMLNWLSKVAAWRRSNIQPPIERIVRLVAKCQGVVDWQSFGIEWPQLEVMSTKQRIDIEQVQTMTDVARVRDLGMSEATLLDHRYSGEYRFVPPVLSEMDKAVLTAHEKAEVEPEVEPEPGTTEPLADPLEEEPKVEPEEAVSPDTALNGAQVTALVSVIQQVVMGMLPRESAVEIITTAFPVDRATAERIMGTVGRGFEAETQVEGIAISPSSNDAMDLIRLIVVDSVRICDDGDGHVDVVIEPSDEAREIFKAVRG